MPLRILPSKQHLVIVLLIFAPTLTGVVYVMWGLHHPHPTVKAPVAINRNGLLPHLYAGPCMNCHRIIETRPMPMSRDNMESFDLTPEQQALLRAGQRVQVPGIVERLRIPAITRSAPLSHLYLGVCDNCHVMLDVKPSVAFMRTAMSRAYKPLAELGLRDERIAFGGSESNEHEQIRRIWGYAAAASALFGFVYIAMRILAGLNPQRFKGVFRLKRWLLVHEIACSVFCVATVVHWYYSDRGNNLLHVALVFVLWLTGAGFALRYRLATSKVRKGVQLVHTQRILSIALVLLIFIGHYLAE